MTDKNKKVAEADLLMQLGKYKEAHILYGTALYERLPTDEDRYCRLRRGVCSRLVALERLEKVGAEGFIRRRYLTEAARWLAKSEANLDSALESATGEDRGKILLEQAATELAIVRFMEMWGGGNTDRRLANAERLSGEAAEILSLR